jgi:hypothetical protein
MAKLPHRPQQRRPHLRSSHRRAKSASGSQRPRSGETPAGQSSAAIDFETSLRSYMSRYHFALNGSLVTIDFDLVSSARLQLNNAATNSRCELPTTPAAAKSTSGSSGRDCSTPGDLGKCQQTVDSGPRQSAVHSSRRLTSPRANLRHRGSRAHEPVVGLRASSAEGGTLVGVRQGST